MVTRCRCTECRKRFVAARTAGARQRVCSEACRAKRRRKLVRRRRRAHAESWRVDERVRQGDLRAKRREERGAGEGAPGSEDGRKCHVPASERKCPEVMGQIRQKMVEAFRLSRATFDRELRRIEREIRPLMDGQVAANGP